MSFLWWAGMDSNHRSRRRQIYSLLPLATREPTHINAENGVANSAVELVNGLEPLDLLITNQLLYQLSYTSISYALIL